MATQTLPTTGDRIRSLRRERGLSLESLAGDADVTPLALGNIERGQAKPQRDTLLKILRLLEKAAPIPITDRRAILSAFGYTDETGAPNQLDIQRAIEEWRQAFKPLPHPAYLIDVTQKIHDWNDAAIAFVGQEPEKLAGLTIFDLLFNPSTHPNLTVLNQEEIARQTLVIAWNEEQVYGGQEWYDTYLKNARRDYPQFSPIYDSIGPEDILSINVNAMGPIILRDQAGHTLQFKIVGIYIVSDPRFCVVQYVPLDTETTLLLSQLAA